jgi:hypothetical protein
MCHIQTTDTTLLDVTVLPLDGSSASGSSDFSAADNQTGVLSGPTLPPNACGVLTLRTDTRGRSHRGRIYLGGIAQSSLNSNQQTFTTTFVSAAETYAYNFRANLAGESAALDLCVASYMLASSSLVTSIVARNYVGTQRRRTTAQP